MEPSGTGRISRIRRHVPTTGAASSSTHTASLSVASTHTQEDATWAAEVTVNEIVAALPEDFSRRLGADQVRFEKTVIDEG